MEDNHSLLKLFKLIFEQVNYEIIGTASNGLDAIEEYKLFIDKPDVVLLDYRLPIKDGIEVAKELIDYHPKIKIIFISADNSVEKEALSIGVLKFLLKPFDINLLLETIKNVCNDINKKSKS
ncbi:MAG: response regulator transcription factor [Promethearchaeota archaeon]